MKSEGDHISVLICTYKRPKLLDRLLKQLPNQETGGLFTYSMVVIDNDHAESAKEIVLSSKNNSPVEIYYCCEPEQNISLARNKAVQNAKGNFLAFIDDDELPVKNWLFCHYKALYRYEASGSLGPVRPRYEVEPPQWIIRGRFCERDSFATGTVLSNPVHTRTGNVLLAKKIFEDGEIKFDPRYGKTGGEDVDFFKRMIGRGYIFIWCDEARVYESVPPERLKRSYILKRALMRGAANSRNVLAVSFDTLKSVTAVVLYTASLPFLLLIGHHLFMRCLMKDCDHIGKLLGLCGFTVVKERGL